VGVKVKHYKKTWYVFINHNGRRKAKKVGSKLAAEQVRHEIEAQLTLGNLGFLKEQGQRPPTFREYADAWLEDYADRQLKPSTANFYREYLRMYVLPAFGDSRLDQIRRDAVKRWLAELAARGLARNTVRLAVSTLRVILNAAIEDSLLAINPAQKLGRLVKVEKLAGEAIALTPEEADRFLRTAKEHCSKHCSLFLTALRAGLRGGELVALRWGDFHFGEDARDPNRYLLVQRNYDRHSGRFLTPKSKKPRRVDLSRELRQVLLELGAQRQAEAVARGQQSIADDLVFPSETGTVLAIDNVIRRHLHPLLQRAGVRRIRFHDLRHTFGSLLIRAGAPLTYVRDQMGHSSIQITVDTYGHMIPGADIMFMDRLDQQADLAVRIRNPGATWGQTASGGTTQVIERIGVSDGIRTRDVQIHSLALYQAELRSPPKNRGPNSVLYFITPFHDAVNGG